MKNLEKLKLQELTLKERVETNGGNGIGWGLLGSAIFEIISDSLNNPKQFMNSFNKGF